MARPERLAGRRPSAWPLLSLGPRPRLPRAEIGGAQKEHFARRVFGVEPDEWQMRELMLERGRAPPTSQTSVPLAVKCLGASPRIRRTMSSPSVPPACASTARPHIPAESPRSPPHRHKAGWSGSSRSARPRPERTDRPASARCDPEGRARRRCARPLRARRARRRPPRSRIGEDARGEDGERTAARAEVKHRGDRLGIADEPLSSAKAVITSSPIRLRGTMTRSST